MSNLIMALRCLEGLVFACDTSYHLQNENCPYIKSISDHLVALIEPDVEVGQRLLKEYIAIMKGVPSQVLEFSSGWAEFARSTVNKQGPVATTGMIFAGMDAPPASIMQLVGIHGSTGYQGANIFMNNVFGGPLNSVARYLDYKMSSRELTLQQAKGLAAFYIVQSQLTLRAGLENWICMATLTYESGFQWVGQAEVTQVMNTAAEISNRVRRECTTLFAPQSYQRIFTLEDEGI